MAPKNTILITDRYAITRPCGRDVGTVAAAANGCDGEFARRVPGQSGNGNATDSSVTRRQSASGAGVITSTSDFQEARSYKGRVSCPFSLPRGDRASCSAFHAVKTTTVQFCDSAAFPQTALECGDCVGLTLKSKIPTYTGGD